MAAMYSCFRITVFHGVREGEEKVGEWGPEIWKILMTVVDRLDELQASSVGRRESINQSIRKGLK